MKDTWFYRDNGSENGPLSFDEIFELARSGKLTRAHTVRLGYDAEWVPAESIVGLFPEPAAVTASASTIADGPQEIASLDDLDFELVSDTPSATRRTSLADFDAPAADGPDSDGPGDSEAPPATKTDDPWFYRKGEAELGPFALDQIIQLAKAGAIGPDDWVRRGTSGAWQRGCKSPHLDGCFEAAATTPPPATQPPPQEPAPQAATASAVEPPPPADVPERKPAKRKTEKRKAKREARKSPPPADLKEDDFDLDLQDDEDDPQSELETSAVVDRWFCRIDDVEHGPLTFDELKSMAKHHRISESNEVREGDDGRWVAAMTIPDLFAGVAAKPEPTPTALPKKSARVAKPSRAPRQPLSQTLKEHKTVLLGVVGVLAAGGLLFLAFTMFSGKSGDLYYNELNSIYTQYKSLRKKEASSAERSQLIAQATDLQQRITEELGKTRDPALRHILFAGRDYLVPMLKKCREESCHDEKAFAMHLTLARKLLDDPNAMANEGQEEENFTEDVPPEEAGKTGGGEN